MAIFFEDRLLICVPSDLAFRNVLFCPPQSALYIVYELQDKRRLGYFTMRH